MSARQAARWKRAACPALARDSFSKSKIWRRNRGFGSHLGGLRVPVAQSSRWALAAPSARFAPSQISAFCALAARSPYICSHLRVALGLRPKCPGCSNIRASLTVALMVSLPRFGSLWAVGPSAHRAHASLRATGHTLPSGASEPPKGVVPPQKWWPSVVAGTSRSSSVTAPPASKCGCGVCPAPQARAKRAPRATRATPAQAFRAPLRRKKRGLPLQQARRAIALFTLPPRQALPRLPLQAPGTSHRTPRAQAFRVSEGHKKRVSPHPPSQAPRSHPPRTTRQRFGEPQLSKIHSESSDMRGGFGSLAQARPPYAASRPGALRRRARGKRRNPGGTDRRQPSFFAAR